MEEEVATAMKAMTNAKTLGPDGLPVELLKRGRKQDRVILLELYRLIILIRREEKVSLQYEDTVITVLHKKGGKTECRKYRAESRSCHTLVWCSLKWLPRGLAITVRPRDCRRRSNAIST